MQNAKPPQEVMSVSKSSIAKLIGFPVIAAAITFLLLMISAGVVSGLPRPMRGESVTAPWAVCVLASVGITLFGPWLLSLLVIRQQRFRIYFLVCLAVTTLVWYFFGFETLLSKAYRRGL
jgi:hypothetical protein